MNINFDILSELKKVVIEEINNLFVKDNLDGDLEEERVKEILHDLKKLGFSDKDVEEVFDSVPLLSNKLKK